jgi:orotate phosphoribosyltransferase
MNKRALSRINVEDGTCLMAKNGLYIGTIKNISFGGLFIESNIEARLMDRIEMSIFLQSDSEEIEIDVVAVATRVGNGGIALKYEYLDPNELQILKSFINNLDAASHSTH